MRMKVAKYISEFFVKQGVTDMFMITGGAAMHLNDAFGHQEEGRLDVAKLLISHGAKKEDKNSKGRSLLDIDLYKEVLSAI